MRLMSLSEEKQESLAGVHRAGRIGGLIIGLCVFVLGIALMIFVFSLAYGTFGNIEASIDQAVPPATATSTLGAGPNGTVIASPQAGNPLLRVAVVLALRLFALLVLGWLAALIAAKGAQMAGYSGRLRE
jgi:hypothetical protein